MLDLWSQSEIGFGSASHPLDVTLKILVGVTSTIFITITCRSGVYELRQVRTPPREKPLCPMNHYNLLSHLEKRYKRPCVIQVVRELVNDSLWRIAPSGAVISHPTSPTSVVAFTTVSPAVDTLYIKIIGAPVEVDSARRITSTAIEAGEGVPFQSDKSRFSAGV